MHFINQWLGVPSEWEDFSRARHHSFVDSL